MKAAQIPDPMAPCLPLETHHYAADQGSALAYVRSPLFSHNKHTNYHLRSAHQVPGSVQALCGCCGI